jgi:hypothetical protein
MANEAQDRLAHALETLAQQIASAPRTVIGTQVSAVAGPGSSGTVIGMQVTAKSGSGGGNVTGFHSEAKSGPDPAADLIRELHEAATAVRQGGGDRSWMQSLIRRVQSLKDRACDAAVVTAVQQAIGAAFG